MSDKWIYPRAEHTALKSFTQMNLCRLDKSSTIEGIRMTSRNLMLEHTLRQVGSDYTSKPNDAHGVKEDFSDANHEVTDFVDATCTGEYLI